MIDMGSQNAKMEIIETDKAFSQMSVEQGAYVAFTAYADNGAVKLQNSSEPVIGLDAVHRLMEGVKGTLKWNPLFVDAAESEDLGYTVGDWELINQNQAGVTHHSRGNYITIWKKQTNGKWKWVFDSGTQKE
jgi:ketosteroid isomerase-like protein